MGSRRRQQPRHLALVTGALPQTSRQR
jgi:hypothetical protein